MVEEKWYCLKCSCCGKTNGFINESLKIVFVCGDCILSSNKAIVIEKICIS